MKKVLLLTTIGIISVFSLIAQPNVFSPTDPMVAYSSAQPSGSAQNPITVWQTIQKWVVTSRFTWDGDQYKSYHFNGMSFRVKFPATYAHNVVDNKKYPVMVFFHGAGEPGSIYDNELQLLHGGEFFMNTVNSGQFDGYLIYPQNQSGGFSSEHFQLIVQILDSMAKYVKLDVDRVIVDGLSAGGSAAFNITAGFPTRVTKSAPSAASANGLISMISSFVHIPIWFATGGLDTNPFPYNAEQFRNAFRNAGGDIQWTLFPTLGHFVWYNHWFEPGFIPYMNDNHKANPLIYFGRNQFCPDSAITARLGITAGFAQYEWRNQAGTIVGTSNEYFPTSYGTYSVRFRRIAGGPWSEWSPKPAVISPKPTTSTPTPTVQGLRSKVLPAPDGSTTVPLVLPNGFEKYEYFRVSDNLLMEDTLLYNAPPGVYRARVKEFFGCNATFSSNFTVISANGPNKPEAAKNLAAYVLSQTSIQLEWSENPVPSFDETNFEIYRGTSQGGPYTLLALAPPNVTTYTDLNLSPNTSYYYLVRAVNNTAAAANSNEANATTTVDNTPPTTPGNLRILAVNLYSVHLQWDPSTDNIALDKYDVYVNGSKLFTTEKTIYEVNGLDPQTTYNFTIKARDITGNNSAASNQVTTVTKMNGLTYYYYEGSWDALPNFSELPILEIGTTANFDIAPRNRNDQFGFVWQGHIRIPTTGNYRFETCSDDGSTLYFNTLYSPTARRFIDNDGLHGTACIIKDTTLTGGSIFPIAGTFFEQGGGEVMEAWWTLTGAGGSNFGRQIIPASAFTGTGSITGVIPAAPSSLRAVSTAFDRINLTWVDNSSGANNETGFEIVRSTSKTGPFANIVTVPAGTIAYTDTGLTANTVYFYKIRAIGTGGESVFVSNYTEANWKLNNNLNDAKGNASRAFTGTNTSFSSTDKKEGTHSLSLNGTSAYVTVNNSSTGQFPSEAGYTQRTVALWIKPTVTTNKRVIFDIGNSSDGMGLRFFNTSNAMQMGFAAGGTRVTAVVNNFASNANWILNGWNHVALVRNGTVLRLYFNGVDVGGTTGPATATSAASNNSRFGYSGTSNSDNVFNELSSGTNDNFSGLMDDIFISNTALTAADLLAMVNNTYLESADTTLALPAVPSAPTVLTTTAVSSSTINLQWNDNSSNETAFQVWRSTNNPLNYRLIATVAGGSGATKTFVDNSLFANLTYYYQVRAVNLGGFSAYSNSSNAKTKNSKPAIIDIRDFTMHYEEVRTLPFTVVDTDGDVQTFTTANLPSFATFQNVSNGNGQIVFTPTFMDQGSYLITVYVNDGNGGKDTTSFTMLVNENFTPTLNPVNNVTMNEGGDTTFSLIANDIESPSYMRWTFTNLPSFCTFTHDGNGAGSLRLRPTYASSGVYQISVMVEDGFGGWISRNFTLSVIEKDPDVKILLNFQNQFLSLAPAPWNNMSSQSISNLKNTLGVTTTVGATVVNSWQFNISSSGAQANGAGVYPDVVMRDFNHWGYFLGNNSVDVSELRITGLDPTKKYNFKFFASNTAPVRTTYAIGAESVSLNGFNNTSETVSINFVTPSPTGVISIIMTGDPNPDIGGIISALEIASQFDDGTNPAKPTNLTGVFQDNVGSLLNWTDVSYNEASYKVFRSTVRSGPYTQLNPGANNANTTNYTDATASQLTQYYYYVRASNSIGDSPSSDTVSILTGNNSPLINDLNDVYVKIGTNFNEDFSVSDYPGDVITVSSPNLPSWAVLQNLGGGNYRIAVTPSNDGRGFTTATIVAKDDKGGETTMDFVLHVADRYTRSFYLNFGDISNSAPSPWNNLPGLLYNGRVDNNLRDETGVPAIGVGFSVATNWSNIHSFGLSTGNNSGIVPDVVLQSGNMVTDNTPRQMSFTGLNNARRYNVVFVGSGNTGVVAVADLKVGGVTQAVANGRFNTNTSAQINGLAPSGGTITFTFTKQAAAKYAYVNAIILEEYVDTFNLSLINPINLYAEPASKTSVKLTWSERSNAEEAYEILRGSTAGSLAVIATVGANSTSYTDNTVLSNTKYFYAVRARDNTPLRFSPNSNVVSTITPKAIVLVNLTYTFIEAVPWNNTAVNPDPFQVFPNLITDQNVNSGISMEITRGFNGQNPFGMQTFGAGGIFPNNVMAGCYWLDKTQLGQFKLSGLNHSKRYRIGFFGSVGPGWVSDEFRDYNTKYSIGNRSVYLNSHWNDSKVVYIGDVVPDQNGEIFLNVTSPLSSEYSFSSAIIIQAYDDVTGGTVENMVNREDFVVAQEDETVDNNNGSSTLTTRTITEKPQLTKVNAYPNPFAERVSIEFYNEAAGNKVSVDIYDLTGRLVFRRSPGIVPVGMNTLNLNMKDSNFSPGIYMVKLNINGKDVSTTKLVKAKE